MPAPPVLLGTYTPPPVKRGDVVRCLYRRADCRVTTWTAAPIPWPRCNQIGIRGGSGLLVTDALVRAIKTESAAALKHWFGVSTKTAWNWRKRFVPGEAHVRTEGDRLMHQAASEAGAAAVRGVPLAADVRARMAAAAKAAGRRPPDRWQGTGWTAAQVALLGTMPDADLAAKLARSVGAVRQKRTNAGIQTFWDGRHRRRPVTTGGG